VIDAQVIKELGKELGIDEVRIANTQPFIEAEKRILEQKNAGLYLNSERWQKRDIHNFCDVKTILPQAKSIITVCQGYLTDEKLDLTEPGKPYGLVARYTWRNHYLDLKRRLRKLGQFMKKESRAFYRVYSNGPVAEKPMAQRSGIGYYGKHSIIINPNYGSWVVLGEIITDIEIEPDEQLEADCGDCQECIDVCPTKAIIRPYIIDRRKCIQARTNWYGVMPSEIARVWGNRLYGCTICQDVCVINKKVKPRSPKTSLGYVGSCLPLLEILKMDELEYRRRYANNQITRTWINFTAIKRNAIIALAHIEDKTTLPLLKEFSKNQDEIIAKTAQWAISNFGGR